MSNYLVGLVVVRPVLISILPSILHKIISNLAYWLLGQLNVLHCYYKKIANGGALSLIVNAIE